MVQMTEATPTDQVTKLFVVRHGETEWNVENRIQGHLDNELSRRGMQQAEALSERLRGMNFDALYSSDLARAAQTAKAISNTLGVEVVTDQRLRERNMGVLQGLTLDEAHVQHTDALNRLRSLDPEYIIPKGESLRQFSDRTVACIEELAQRHLGGLVLIATHGGVLECLMNHVLETPLDAPREFMSANASLNIYLCEAGEWSLETWGDISHLREIGTLDDA